MRGRGGSRRPGRCSARSRRRRRRERSRRAPGGLVIKQAPYEVEPWSLRESSLELDLLAQSESVFALANGHVGLRGNLDEGEPHGIPGTYRNAFYEVLPLPYAEPGYGSHEAGATVGNGTNRHA